MTDLISAATVPVGGTEWRAAQVRWAPAGITVGLARCESDSGRTNARR